MAQPAPKIEFRHFILTRFNLPLSSRKEGIGIDVCGEEYLSYRFKLFEEFCLPSVKKQSCQNFKWLLLFDENTPKVFKERAEGWHKNYQNLIPCFLDVEQYGGIGPSVKPVIDVDNDETMLRITREYVSDVLDNLGDISSRWCITTRLDSDDAIHQDLIKKIQQIFLKAPGESVIDFVASYKYISEEHIVYRYWLKNGHFISLVESPDRKPRTVLFCNHLMIDNFVHVQHVYGLPLQLELIHGGNVVNGYTELSVSGLLCAFFHFHKKCFGIKDKPYSRRKALWMVGSLLKHRLIGK